LFIFVVFCVVLCGPLFIFVVLNNGLQNTTQKTKI
jgi:hypothetical protein